MNSEHTTTAFMLESIVNGGLVVKIYSNTRDHYYHTLMMRANSDREKLDNNKYEFIRYIPKGPCVKDFKLFIERKGPYENKEK